ncbi:hypothetical protein AX15_000819 [Amanita polypyramis BW_CC]|nr:hypothetical protein AX15_000819 [Amanita polypyramis BW_CC]
MKVYFAFVHNCLSFIGSYDTQRLCHLIRMSSSFSIVLPALFTFMSFIRQSLHQNLETITLRLPSKLNADIGHRPNTTLIFYDDNITIETELTTSPKDRLALSAELWLGQSEASQE